MPVTDTSCPQESVWILGDQLSTRHPGLIPGRRVVLIESLARLNQRRYHRRKLVLIVSAMRHFAAELRAAGYEVDIRSAADFLQGLRDHVAQFGVRHLVCMAAAEYNTRQFQQNLAAELGIAVTILPNTLFLLNAIHHHAHRHLWSHFIGQCVGKLVY